MLRSVSDVEKPSGDGDKGIIVFTRRVSFGRDNDTPDSRFQEAISVPVDDLDGLVVGNADVVWLNSNHFTELLMHFIHGLVPPSVSDLPHKP